MQRGLIKFEPELIVLNHVLKESVEIFRHSALSKSIALTVDVPDNLKVFADLNMLGSVIRNLTSNSIKFTKRGGNVTIKAHNTSNNTVEIAVTDTGIGMTKEMVENLFKISRNSSRPGTEGEPSTGLGLLLCKDFVEKQGGEIWAKSEAGKGSTIISPLKHRKNIP
jgi:signal transduction histidine kinase